MKKIKISNTSVQKEAEKENVIKDLIAKIQGAGYKVRREKLKQGPGWRTVSGSCRLQEEKLIFVDRKNSVDDQLGFLKACALDLKISETEVQNSDS